MTNELPRTVGGELLRQSLDELKRQLEAAPVDGRRKITGFLAYDKESGAQIGAAIHLRGPKGSEWLVSGVLSRKVQAAQAPYAVRLELQGSF